MRAPPQPDWTRGGVGCGRRARTGVSFISAATDFINAFNAITSARPARGSCDGAAFTRPASDSIQGTPRSSHSAARGPTPHERRPTSQIREPRAGLRRAQRLSSHRVLSLLRRAGEKCHPARCFFPAGGDAEPRAARQVPLRLHQRAGVLHIFRVPELQRQVLSDLLPAEPARWALWPTSREHGFRSFVGTQAHAGRLYQPAAPTQSDGQEISWRSVRISGCLLQHLRRADRSSTSGSTNPIARSIRHWRPIFKGSAIRSARTFFEPPTCLRKVYRRRS